MKYQKALGDPATKSGGNINTLQTAPDVMNKLDVDQMLTSIFGLESTMNSDVENNLAMYYSLLSIGEQNLNVKQTNELNSLKQQKENSRAKYSTEIENKIKQIDSIKNKKIKSLPVQNYSFNKSKIVNEYDPKITQLKKELNSKLNDNETFWNDRIKVKEEELERFLVNNDALYEDKIIAEQEYKRNEFRNKNNLSTIRDRLDEKYKKDLSVINDKSEKKKI